MSRYLILITFFAFCACSPSSDKITIASPGKVNSVDIKLEQNRAVYSVYHGKTEIIQPSQLGLVFRNAPSLTAGMRIIGFETQTVSDQWTQPWGEKREINNHYNEGIIHLETKGNSDIQLDLIFRVYDDGIAFRYHVKSLDRSEEVVLLDEITEFNLAEDVQAWWIPAYQPNRYEYLYKSTKISELDTVHTPLTMRFKNGTHVSIHEAALTDYSSMQIAGRKSTRLKCDLAPWANGDKVRTSVPFQSPWRTIKITDSAVELLSSFLTLNCNEPSQIEDVSWIKPSKYVGIWWGMIIGKWTWGTGFRHGATTDRAKSYIDFAAEHGFDEVLVEGISADFEGLFPGDTVLTSFTKWTPDFDLEAVQAYARSKGVSLQAYHETSGSTTNYLAQLDSAFAIMRRLGMDKAKIGHVGALLNKKEFHYGQFGVDYYRKVLKKAAEYKIAVNFHEPIKSTGERRTYPNMISREGARGMEYNAWGNRGNPPAHTTTLPFTRLLEAPMDFTPGIFDLLYEKLDNDDDLQKSLYERMDNDVDLQIPVKLTFVDHGNGYGNVHFKGGESFWQSKPMNCDKRIDNGDTVYTWTILEHMRAGEWEWGVKAQDIVSDKKDLWLLNVADLPNRKVIVSADGTISGQTSFELPDLRIDPMARKFSRSTEIKEVDMNVLGVTQRVNTTLAKQLALYVIVYSPIQMASDFIENYENEPAFQFIKDVPVDWEETIAINGEIGEYVTIARKDRNSNDWYLGSITDTVSRTFNIDLSFLGKDGVYLAEYYADGQNADWETNPYEMSIGQQEVKETYNIYLAKGGGHAVRFRYMEAR